MSPRSRLREGQHLVDRQCPLHRWSRGNAMWRSPPESCGRQPLRVRVTVWKRRVRNRRKMMRSGSPQLQGAPEIGPGTAALWSASGLSHIMIRGRNRTPRIHVVIIAWSQSGDPRIRIQTVGWCPPPATIGRMTSSPLRRTATLTSWGPVHPGGGR